MPIQRCTLSGGKKGWKWGKSGKCYPTRAQAVRQAIAIRAGGYTANVAASTLRTDPTLTGALRRRFMADLAGRFNRFKRQIVRVVGREDWFGLKDNQSLVVQQSLSLSSTQFDITDLEVVSKIRDLQARLDPNDVLELERNAHITVRFGLHTSDPQPVAQITEGFGGVSVRLGTLSLSTSGPPKIDPNGSFIIQQRFRFLTSPEKIAKFQAIIQKELQGQVLFIPDASQVESAYWHKYIEEGYQKGAGRAFDNVRKPALTFSPGEGDFFRGSKQEFLRQAFAQKVSVEKVKLLASRVFTELKGVTESMSQQMTRVLTDGLVQGKSPRDTAKELAKRVDVGRSRALTIARTETIRAHSEGNLDALEQLGITEVGVQAEWSAAADACPICTPMDGVVMKISEARGTVPRHPNCRCGWIPSNVGETTAGQKRTKGDIQQSIRKSLKAELPKRTKRTIAQQAQRSTWPGGRKVIDKQRVLSAVQKEQRLRELPVGSRRPLVDCTGAILGNWLAIHARPCKIKEAALQKARAKRAKSSHKPSSAEKQRHAEANEVKLAKQLKGKSLEDNEPMDIILKSKKQEHGIELKTMLDNGNDKITMHPESKARKLLWQEAAPNRTIHTVVLDDRDVFMGGKFKHQFSGSKIYYKRGVGAFRARSMTPVKDVKTLRRLIEASDDELTDILKSL